MIVVAGILYAIMQEEPEPFAQVNPDLPENLEAIVFKALKKDKEERYQSTDELIKDLQGIEVESRESWLTDSSRILENGLSLCFD